MDKKICVNDTLFLGKNLCVDLSTLFVLVTLFVLTVDDTICVDNTICVDC